MSDEDNKTNTPETKPKTTVRRSRKKVSPKSKASTGDKTNATNTEAEINTAVREGADTAGVSQDTKGAVDAINVDEAIKSVNDADQGPAQAETEVSEVSKPKYITLPSGNKLVVK